MRHFSLPKDGGLFEELVPKDILNSYNRIFTETLPDSEKASRMVAGEIASAINAHPAGIPFKLGLSTGRTPVLVFEYLHKMYEEGGLSFRNVEVFSIDEFFSVSSDTFRSRNAILYEKLLDRVDIDEDHIHALAPIPDYAQAAEFCARYEAGAQKLDLLLAGIGEHGQIGFNELGANPRGRTRIVQLQYESRKRQAKHFGGDISQIPKAAVTIGLGTMLSAKRVILMAWGESKADAVKHIVEDECTPDYPASFFQLHSDVTLYTDELAAGQLVRYNAPWLIGPCDWTPKFRRKAVIWLCQKLAKPILKLTLNDYLMNSLGELVEKHGPFDKINIEVFNDLQHTITGWPGGKPDADDSTRPVSSAPYPKRVLIFSPHPDDDVISMGGTFIRLVHQGHQVQVAYQTSGNVAVHDDVVVQHLDAARQMGLADMVSEIRSIIAAKKIGLPEPRELLDLKAAIRRSEALGACRSFGLPMGCVHFLNLPFYESGGVTKLPCTQDDVDIVKELLSKIRPDQVYMAGDLADPHGTHRVCTEVALEAIEQLREENSDWVDGCSIWLYRGAWMEWDLCRVDMAVPLSPDEVLEKRHAIYHHLSQKDIVPFPGDDTREFWQRAEDRTCTTARLYDQLGMAEYQAIEVFVKL